MYINKNGVHSYNLQSCKIGPRWGQAERARKGTLDATCSNFFPSILKPSQIWAWIAAGDLDIYFTKTKQLRQEMGFRQMMTNQGTGLPAWYVHVRKKQKLGRREGNGINKQTRVKRKPKRGGRGALFAHSLQHSCPHPLLAGVQAQPVARDLHHANLSGKDTVRTGWVMAPQNCPCPQLLEYVTIAIYAKRDLACD